MLRAIKVILYIFPIHKNRIIFVSQRGIQYSCNPKYLFEHIYNEYGSTYQYIWCLNDKKIFPDEFKNVKIVRFLSLRYVWYTMTSKYYVSNIEIEPIFPGRKGQMVINTWHGGGAYKFSNVLMLPFYIKARRQYMMALLVIREKQTSFVISSCRKFTECFSKDWITPAEKFLPIGMPRNDILFTDCSFKKKIAEHYKLNQKQKIILYAPTYRGATFNPESFDFTFNVEDLIKNTKIRFGGEYILFYRGHLFFSFDYVPDGVINASKYPDMQELLSATDILITDYSASMWDFSLMKKPCFLYAPDVKKYQEEQGFYTPIEEWPFPLAETNEQLMENILQFDEEKYKQAVQKHHADLGSYETGNACEQFCEYVLGS
ncbi:MAG: CDP-glycerol glycerophosphotransferase family protein [Treponema sp.]|jgi:CDP-glycerol glycerophosphotransferase|nr:CDP-glycerol glycerophosphotransferase family protein [Treponema sp.]